MALISSALLCACSPSNPSSNAQKPSLSGASPPSSISITVPATSTTTRPLGSLLKKDMAYADARKALLAQGWAPEKDAECKANMGTDAAATCDDMPELSIYSDQGVLMTHFRHGRQQLIVSSYGMLSDWRVSGEESRLRITDWQISNKNAKDNSTIP